MNSKVVKNRKIFIAIAVLLVMVLFFLGSCGQRKEPTVVTFWHVYGAQTESPMNEKVEEFNKTVGKKKNIQVKVTSISDNNSIHKNILESAYGNPGANEMPDMFIAYPKTVRALPDRDILVDFKDVYTEKDLDKFIPTFLKEGNIDGQQLVLPIAKSTEILYVNKCIFNKFSKDTGVTLKDLETWEGLFKVCDKYYKWTDNKTPNIKNDGKAFFAYDDHLDYFQGGVYSLGGNFFNKDGKAIYGKEFEKVWSDYGEAAVNGQMWLGNGYATEPFRTGEAVCCVASSAGVMYFADQVTYADNTTEDMEIISLPVPKFEKGNKVAIQRGAGICMVKSTEEKEEACKEFISWLTEKENNVKLVTKLGYIPVTKSAYEELPEVIKTMDNNRFKGLYEAVMKTNNEYEFYVAPEFEEYLEFESKFEENIRNIMKEGKESVKTGQNSKNAVAKCLEKVKKIQ